MDKITNDEKKAIIDIVENIERNEAVSITVGNKKIIISRVNESENVTRICRVRSHRSYD